MTNAQRTTKPTAENRTSDKEVSVIEERTNDLTLREGRGGVMMARLRRIAALWGRTTIPFFKG
jgi:hypothetical protein